MTDHQHPITPPPELVQQWLCSDDYLWGPLEQASITITTNRLQNVATAAAQWGADQELEACVELLRENGWHTAIRDLRAARRPKPPSLKEQALLQLDTLNADLAMHGRGCDLSQIRRALEQLND
jgi:hypothetical protein